MGGGDLNQKKSWHPHTIKNQEKVWKAEQAKEQEQRRLDDLRKEIKEERDREELVRIGERSGVLSNNDNNAKLEWMYKNGNELINREEYLLGRKIDKSFETLQDEEKAKNTVGMKQPINHVEHECVPFSIREYLNVESREQVDLQRKTMEDPLMLIKQREMESRRKLLENPVKLKEIHRILKTEKNLKSSKNKKSKKSKKSKKKKHKKGDNSSNSETSSDDDSKDSDTDDRKLDKELAKRVKQLKGETITDITLSKLLDAKYKTISKELDKATSRKSKRSQRSSSESDRDIRENNVRRNQRNDNGQWASRNYNGPNRERQNYRRERSPDYRNYKMNNRRDQKTPERRGRSRSPQRDRGYKGKNGSINQRNMKNGSRSPSPQRDRDHKRRSRSTDISDRYRRNIKNNSRSRSPQRDRVNKRRSRSTDISDRNRKNFKNNSPSRSSQRDRDHKRRSRSTDISDRNRKNIKNNSRSRSPRRDRQHKRSRSTSQNVKDTHLKHHESRSIEKSPIRNVTSKSNAKKSLTDEERTKRLREMMDNAVWREADRTEVVQKHREAYAREEAQNQSRDFDKEFINKEVKKAIANQSNIGSRIRANLNNIQRTSSAMETNFARK